MKIELEDIVQWFPPDRLILDGVNLVLKEGEQVSILGEPGSGKSLLVGILGGTLRACEGRIRIDGEEWQDKKKDRWERLRRKKYGILLREPGFMKNLNMIDNVALPLLLAGENGLASRKKARRQLQDLGVENAAYRNPGQLSLYESSVMGLARAVLHQPEILLADSFTEHLTREEEAKVWKRLRSLPGGGKMSLIQVTGRRDSSQYTERRYFLRKGRIYEDESI